MEGEGTILIVGVGTALYDLVSSENRFWEKHGFNSSVVVPQAHFLADCRAIQTNANKVFVQRVLEARHLGLNVVLLASSADVLDRRLRDQAIVVQLRSAVKR